MNISLVVACDQNKGIGINNQLPWKLPSDMKFFKEKTSGHHILMGRKTFESLGKPLPNRTSLVISRNKDLEIPGAHVFGKIEDAIEFAKNNGEEELMIIGGAEIYKQSAAFADTVYITEVEGKFEVDAWLDLPMEKFKEVNRVTVEPDEKNAYRHHFVSYQKQ